MLELSKVETEKKAEFESIVRRNVEFKSEGTIIRGWLYLPNENETGFQTIVLAHGYGSLKEMHLDRFAQNFASNGLAALVFDYRGFGDSDGYPRQEVNPWSQIEDYRNAITYAMSLKEVDGKNIGVWGTSYSGGHVLVLAATDPRIKCVVSQVPTISGTQSSKRRVPAHLLKDLYDSFAEDRLARMEGEEPVLRCLVSDVASDNPVYSSSDAVDWYLSSGERSPNWVNAVTQRSVEYSRYYDPGYFISKISPVPLLLIVATEDYVTPTDLALEAYEHALEPKKLALISGGHFDPYVKNFDKSSSEAINWFKAHLTN